MNRATPVVLAVLLVSSLFAIPVVGSTSATANTATESPDASLSLLSHQGPITDVDDSTNRLRLNVERDERVEYGIDLGLVLASTDDQLRVDHEQYTLIDREFATASNDEREQMVRESHAQLKERIEQLEKREKEVVRAHAAGDVTNTELIHVLVQNYKEAAALADLLDELTEERMDEVDGYELSGQQTRADEELLELHQSSIRADLYRASQASGTDDRVDVRIQTSSSGYRLSMIDGDTYVFETVRFDHRDTEENQFENYTNTETIDYITDLYPWAGDDQGWGRFTDASNENLYITKMDTGGNHLSVYLDAGTGEVYREVQELSIESLPAAERVTETDDGLGLSVTNTPADGPVEVTVNDTETGEPVTATITADGTEVGRTNGDGTLWFLPPISENEHIDYEYELTAETDTRRVNATITTS